MSDAARAWLVAHAADVPPALHARMLEAADNAAPAASDAAELVEAALDCLRVALDRCDDRAAALHLLAADGLVTYACELASERADELDAVCTALAPEQLQTLVAEHAA